MSVLIGVSVPSGLHGMPGEQCPMQHDMNHASMADHMSDCPMEKNERSEEKSAHISHDFGAFCACSTDQAPLKTEVTVQLKVNVPALQLSSSQGEILSPQSKSGTDRTLVAEHCKSPPVYLLNLSFLN
ncbi:hypothetical protein AB2B38_003245 [Balneola sp. MJW-20]|uniref:hypothetical protein n=1 Tax=Gracilimonas aurantiaca TaxID=3234185 RepID=UPI003467AEA0